VFFNSGRIGTFVKYIKQRLQDGAHPYPQSYYAASANAVPPRPALQDEVETDVCVIGAGYTGLSSALFLLENGFRVTVWKRPRSVSARRAATAARSSTATAATST
jgi:gamma-glutamylputrescine oxidase